MFFFPAFLLTLLGLNHPAIICATVKQHTIQFATSTPVLATIHHVLLVASNNTTTLVFHLSFSIQICEFSS